MYINVLGDDGNMNIPEEQRKLIKAIEEIKDVNKLCEYLNTDYERMSGLDKNLLLL